MLASDCRAEALRRRAVISHDSAPAWWGLVELALPLHLTVPRARRRREPVEGVTLHRQDLRQGQWCRKDGALVTTPARTVEDLARSRGLDTAVVAADAFLRARLVPVDTLRARLREARGPGSPVVKLVSDLVDSTSESELETRSRLLLWHGGLPQPVSQYVVRDRLGQFVARVDFAWPEHKLILECDGMGYHADGVSFRRDRRRWSRLTALGWKVIVVTWADVLGDPAYVVTMLQALLATRSTHKREGSSRLWR